MTGSDLRHSLRLLARAPAFTLPAVLSLAVGIAVNTTTFTVLNALLFRPLVDAGPGDIVRIGRSMSDDGTFRSLSYDEFDFVRANATSFQDLAGHEIVFVPLSAGGTTRWVSAEVVTPNYFGVLGQHPRIGRVFDAVPSDENAVVISDRFWRSLFASSPDAVGRRVVIRNRPFTIAGVASQGFTGTFPGVATDLWLPSIRTQAAPRTDPRALESLSVIGVLREATPIAAARAELEVLSRRLMALDPQRDRARGLVIGEARGVHPAIAGAIRPFVLGMQAVAGIALLTVCANVAGLLLARTRARRRELGIRLALGATRWRVIGLLLFESGVLALTGATVGWVLSFWALRALEAFVVIPGPAGMPVFLSLRLDVRVQTFTAAVAALATLAFGLLPAIQSTGVDLLRGLGDSPSAPDRRRARGRAVLVSMQVAVSVVLMVSALLLVKSVGNSTRIDLGFDPDHVAVVSFDLEAVGYGFPSAQAFYADLLRRARAFPDVERASLAAFVPMAGRGSSVTIGTHDAEALSVPYNRVTNEYLATVGQQLLRGREFGAAEQMGTPPVAIVNETLASRLWPDTDPLGKRFRVSYGQNDRGAEHEVVGVARNARFGSFGGEVGPFVFLPAWQEPARALTLHVRTASDLPAIVERISRLVSELDAGVTPQSGMAMRDAVSFALIPAQVAQTVLGVASAIALLLTLGGLYGLVGYTLEQRMKEIGIRVALGASRWNVFQVIVGGTMWLAAGGMAAGLILSAAIGRLLAWMLIGLSPTDPPTFAGVALLIFALTLAAGYGAARKGLRLDPAAVLKYE